MYMRNKSLRDMPDEIKPREKMLRFGPEKLSEEELLAIILGSGTKDMDVITLSKEILKLGWKELFNLSPKDLMEKFKGIGEAKACQIRAIIELSKRINDPYEGIYINNPEDVYNFIKDKIDERKEYLFSLYLSPANKLLSYEIIAIGNMNTLYAEPKEILYHAIITACYGIILVHNHPKGELKASKEDLEFTYRVKKACEIMGFELLDHLIINSKDYFSMKREGLI